MTACLVLFDFVSFFLGLDVSSDAVMKTGVFSVAGIDFQQVSSIDFIS